MTAPKPPADPPANPPTPDPFEGVSDEALMARLKRLGVAGPPAAAPKEPSSSTSSTSSTPSSSGQSAESLSDTIELVLRRREEQRAIARNALTPAAPPAGDPPKPKTWRERIWGG